MYCHYFRSSGIGSERTLLSDEWHTPCEDVHKVGKPVWMRSAVELPNVHDIALVLEHGRFVVVDVEVVGGREDGHDRGEACRFRLAIHAIPKPIVNEEEIMESC